MKACTICYFKPTGRFLGHFGARGAADNQFTTPTGITIDSSDRIYVVDSHVHAIKVFGNDGEFLFKFGVNGSEPGCLHLPTRVTFGDTNLLFISDTGNNRIQVSSFRSLIHSIQFTDVIYWKIKSQSSLLREQLF